MIITYEQHIKRDIYITYSQTRSLLTQQHHRNTSYAHFTASVSCLITCLSFSLPHISVSKHWCRIIGRRQTAAVLVWARQAGKPHWQQSGTGRTWCRNSPGKTWTNITHQQVGLQNIRQLQNSSAFSALMLLVGWQEGHPACKKLSGGVLAWSEVQTCIWPSWYHCHSLSSASVKNPDWFYLSCTSSPR